MEQVVFHRLVLVIVCRLVRDIAKPDVQILALDGLAQRFFILLGSQMGQKVTDIKDRISRVLTDLHLQHAAVLQCHHAVQRQRNRRPLVFAQASVVVGLAQRYAIRFVERHLF